MTSAAERQDLARLYTSLRRIRRVEEATAEIYPSDKIKSPVHLAIGQEQVSVALCDSLTKDDVVCGSYRSHALYLAKGGALPAMMAEMFGKDTGCARGKGGSMHIVDMAANVMGSSAVVATQIPNATGWALAAKMQGRNRVVCAFFGDGATEEGCFWESLNFAALKKLPILFVCENNGYAIHEPLSKRWGAPDLCAKVNAFGVPAARVDDGDIFAIRDHAAGAIAAIRKGEGPRFIECNVYRMREHVGPNEDFDQGYRPRAEAEGWVATDQLDRLAAMLDPVERDIIDRAIEDEIAAAIRFAEESPNPLPQELRNHVFA